MADQNSCGVALGLFTASSSLRLLSPDLGHEGSHGIGPQLQTLHSTDGLMDASDAGTALVCVRVLGPHT